MVPTLRDRDLLLVRLTDRVRAGDVVLGRFRDRPDRPVLKRIERRVADGWWLVSDNPFVVGASEAHGAADVVGRVVLRLGRAAPRFERVRRSE